MNDKIGILIVISDISSNYYQRTEEVFDWELISTPN